MADVKYTDIQQMLEEMGELEMSQRLAELSVTAEGSKLDSLSFLNDIVTTAYVQFSNRRYERNVRLGRLLGRCGDIRDLYTHDGRVYNTDNALKQVISLSFIRNGVNVSVFGSTAAGKSYVLTSVGLEACRQGYRVLYIDFLDLLDDLEKRRLRSIDEYSKRVRYYVRMPLLIIDDFLTCSDMGRYTQFTNLFDLMKKRSACGNSTMIATQYAPNEWPKIVSGESHLSGEIDAIRRRLIDKAIVISIDKKG